MEWQRPLRSRPSPPKTLLHELLERNFIYTAVTAPRTVFEKVGQFDPSLKAAIDYEMWLRIAAHGYVSRPPSRVACRLQPGSAGSISANRTAVS